MTHPHPWNNAYVVAVADQILWNYETVWQRITDIDPEVSYERMRSLLTVVKSQDSVVDHEIEQLYQEVVRFRQTGSKVFVQAIDIPDHIFCTCEFPLEYRGIPGPDEVARNEIQILHMGDMPPTTYDWLHRAEIARFGRLLYLVLFNCALGMQPLGMALSSLLVLKALDLRENGLTDLPEEVLSCQRLEFLDLRDNKFATLPDLSSLKALRCLRVARTNLPPAAINRLREELPACDVVT